MRPRGENLIVAVEIDGVHVCHPATSSHLLTEEELELGPIDVLLVPAGGNFYYHPRRSGGGGVDRSLRRS